MDPFCRRLKKDSSLRGELHPSNDDFPSLRSCASVGVVP